MDNENDLELKEIEQKQMHDYSHVLAQIKSPQEQQKFKFDKQSIEKALNSLKKVEKNNILKIFLYFLFFYKIFTNLISFNYIFFRIIIKEISFILESSKTMKRIFILRNFFILIFDFLFYFLFHMNFRYLFFLQILILYFY